MLKLKHKPEISIDENNIIYCCYNKCKCWTIRWGIAFSVWFFGFPIEHWCWVNLPVLKSIAAFAGV